jgi:hypothetical protein
MDEDMVSKVYDPQDSDLPEHIKLALKLVDMWVEDAGRTVDDAFFDRLREHYDDKALVELAIAIGYFDFSHRFNAVMGVEPVHPGVYQAGTSQAPQHMRDHLASLGMFPPEVVTVGGGQ